LSEVLLVDEPLALSPEELEDEVLEDPLEIGRASCRERV
jgi:hypothetical protein